MKLSFLLFFLLPFIANSQRILVDSLNTAKNCGYMSDEEKEMIYEINLVRTNPESYLQNLEPRLVWAKEFLKKNGKGPKSYSLSISIIKKNGNEQKTIDTIWFYNNVERVKALSTLITDLKNLKKLSVLQPDSGIYLAAKKHAADNEAHDWNLGHTGSDGSQPWDRICFFSPQMSFGSENIGGISYKPTPFEIVNMLLVDAGITGYGHRYNLLNPRWTHVACSAFHSKKLKYYWWIQNFGVQKK